MPRPARPVPSKRTEAGSGTPGTGRGSCGAKLAVDPTAPSIALNWPLVEKFDEFTRTTNISDVLPGPSAGLAPFAKFHPTVCPEMSRSIPIGAMLDAVKPGNSPPPALSVLRKTFVVKRSKLLSVTRPIASNDPGELTT